MLPASVSIQRVGGTFDDSVPGDVTRTVLSGDGTTCSTTWLASLPLIQVIPPGGLSNVSPGRAFFVPSSLQTGTSLGQELLV